MIKRSPLVLLALLVAAGAAEAQGRPDSTTMSCAQAAALVRSRGELILGTGGMTYDRYVADRRFCAPTEQIKTAFAPAADTRRCFVGYTCYEPFVDPSDAFH